MPWRCVLCLSGAALAVLSARRASHAGGPFVAPPSLIAVSREVALPADIAKMRDAVLVVTVEDVTELGGKAPVLARLELRRLFVNPIERLRLKVTFGPIPAPSEDSVYNMRVHLDVTGDGKIDPGDYLSMERHVVKEAAGGDAVIRLTPVARP